jgi:hypothetical protein
MPPSSIHCNDARARWLVGRFSIGRPFERRFDGPDDLVAPHFVDCARCLGVAFIRRHPVVPSWLGIALQPAARGTAAWTSYLVSPLADGGHGRPSLWHSCGQRNFRWPQGRSDAARLANAQQR